MTQTPTGRVLLIEDEPEQAELLKRWMQNDLGFEVEIAADGMTGGELLESPRFDMIITDVGLPGHDGLRLVDKSKELFPRRPAMVITAFEGRAVLLQALRHKADDFISKPLSRDYAIKRVAKLFEEGQRVARTDPAPAPKTVVAISAHPDDAEIGCGGTLLRHREAGDRIVLVVLTNGARGGCKSTRKDEAKAAADRLGAELVLLGLEDGAVSPGPETIIPLEEVIKRENPDVVYTHTTRDTHQDHRAAAQATRVAARGVKSLFCYQSPSTTVEFQPTKFIAIGNVLSDKLELLEAFGTQTGIRSYLGTEAIQSTAIYWGRFAGFEPAEPLEVVRDHA